jgi:hypothetical protein
VLGVPGGNLADGVEIQQFTDNREANQQWLLVPVPQAVVPDPHDLFKIVSQATGKVLDVPGGNLADGVKIQQFTDNGGANQQWQLVQVIEPALVGAKVSFHTNDEDKDGDTNITVTVQQSNGIIAARVDDSFGGFPNDSDKGPYCLTIMNAGPKSAVAGGSVTVRIDPNGDDTWRFNFSITLLFSDGSSFDIAENNVELSEANRAITIVSEP